MNSDHKECIRFVARYACESRDWDYLYRLYLRFWMPRGWTMQSSQGLYTYFLLRKGNMVAKFSSEEKGGQPDNYPQFAMWATKQSSPHLPKIYQARFLKRYGIFCCVMERLNSFDSNQLDDIIWDCPEYNPLNSAYKFPSKMHWVAALVISTAQKRDISRLMGSRVGSLVQTFNRMLSAMGWPSDLHGGNVMYRDNGTIVITDPYASVAGSFNIADAIPSFDVSCNCALCRNHRG